MVMIQQCSSECDTHTSPPRVKLHFSRPINLSGELHTHVAWRRVLVDLRLLRTVFLNLQFLHLTHLEVLVKIQIL